MKNYTDIEQSKMLAELLILKEEINNIESNKIV